VPRFGNVRYRELYPGIDAVFHGRGPELEYDFEVAPGADPGRVRLRFDGVSGARIDAAGDLRLGCAGGDVVLRRPAAFQSTPAGRSAVTAAYRIDRASAPIEVGFEVGAWDRARPLVIDPVLAYASVFGGSGNEAVAGLAIDAAGNAYVAGSTTSVNFPTTPGAVNTSGGTAFVTELNPSGTAVIYSTYFGGTGTDTPYGVAVDGIGSVYVTGSTTSTDLPGTSGALQPQKKAGLDAFVVKLLPLGTSLGYATYLGGNGADVGRAVAVDATGNAYVAGSTSAADFPTSLGAFRTLPAGGTDAFVAKVDPFGTSLAYATYLGGGNSDTARAIAVDRTGSAYVTGETASSDLPVTTGALQMSRRGATDAFVARVEANGARLGYCTYAGGDGDDAGRAVTVDATGSAYVAGSTTATAFPTTSGAFLRSAADASASFAFRLTSSGGAFVYSTLLTSGVADAASAIVVDELGSAWIAGRTSSTALPVSSDAFQKGFGSAALYRTLDAGLSWEAASAGIGGLAVLGIAID
ncbi:MAG: hypothetical protein FJX57_25180, partial [Alphaproteobacteria bacterium]|nr:hypothetical protein [Alphaproteobacteria bacterium]